MSDEPESLVLRFMRRLDDRLTRIERKLDEHGARLSRLEQEVAAGNRSFDSAYAILMQRFDNVEHRLDRVERRLELRDDATTEAV